MMKANKIIMLLLMITVFTLIFELEGRVRSYSKALYDRFLVDLTIPETTEGEKIDLIPLLSSYNPDR